LPSEQAAGGPTGGEDARVSPEFAGAGLEPGQDRPEPVRDGGYVAPTGFGLAQNARFACRPENRSHRIGCWRGHLTPGSCGAPFWIQGPEVTPARSVCCPLIPVFVIKWSTHCDRG
jgi:hypothetical protein